jgi:hypothetical protein
LKSRVSRLKSLNRPAEYTPTENDEQNEVEQVAGAPGKRIRLAWNVFPPKTENEPEKHQDPKQNG